MSAIRPGLGLILALMVLACATSGSVLAVQEDRESASSEGATVDEAVRFRSTFGLRADDQFVRDTFASPLYSSDAYGVPLSEAEQAELFRRARIETALDAGALEFAQAQPGYAGVYLDQQRDGRPVFLYAGGGTASLVDALAALLPRDARVEVRDAVRTMKELVDLKSRIEADVKGWAQEGITVLRVSIRPSINTVRIGVPNVTDFVETTLKARYGEHVVVYAASPAVADACGIDDCWPPKGGIAIRPSNQSTPKCTAGFIVERTDNGVPAILTAGHCIDRWGGTGQGWRHADLPIGTALAETWQDGGTSDADVGLIWIQSGPAGDMVHKNQMRRTSTSIASVNGYAIGVSEGGQACRKGMTSLHDCGAIQDPDVGHPSPVPNWGSMWVSHTTEINIDSQGGDSGGSVFRYPGGGTCCSPITALGTHVHSTDPPSAPLSWFSPYWTGRADYNAIPSPVNYTYNICVNSGCIN